MRKPLVLSLITLGLIAGPGAASAAAANYGPFSSKSSCQHSAATKEMHGYRISSRCTYKAYGSWRPGWYYSAYYPKG